MKCFYNIVLLITITFIISCGNDNDLNVCKGVTCSGQGVREVIANRAICNCNAGYTQDGNLNCIKVSSNILCDNIDCGKYGVCRSFGSKAACNCNDGYTSDKNKCVPIADEKIINWCGINWYGSPNKTNIPSPIYIPKNYKGSSSEIYAQVYQPNITDSSEIKSELFKAQIGYTKGEILYPVNYNQLKWINAKFNVKSKNNYEYVANFPSNEIGDFKFIARFSIDDGKSWQYCDTKPNKITSNDIKYGKAKVIDEIILLDTLKYNNDLKIKSNSYSFSVSYNAPIDIDFEKSKFYLNGKEVDLKSKYDKSTKTFSISESNLEENKYSYLFRIIDVNGINSKSLFVPIWIEKTKFVWKDAFIYQIMTDRFYDGDKSNNSPVEGVDFDKNWQGGDFKGITEKIKSGYFTDMGVNVLWISSPITNTDGKGVGIGDGKWYSAYHSYWPIATGWTYTNKINGINTPIDPHFGTEEDLKELIRVAHKHGIRVLADFVANHVFSITNSDNATGSISPWGIIDSYFHGLKNPFVCGWEKPIICWFTNYLPDLNYSNPILMNNVMEHAMWIIKEYDFDGFRLDAVKHMIMDFTTTIRQRIKDEIQVTGIHSTEL